MNVQKTGLAGVLIIEPDRFGDHRGFFAETYSQRVYAELGVDVAFVQDNHSLSAAAARGVAERWRRPSPFPVRRGMRRPCRRLREMALDRWSHTRFRRPRHRRDNSLWLMVRMRHRGVETRTASILIQVLSCSLSILFAQNEQLKKHCPITSGQVRAARAMLEWSATELSAKSGLARRTIQSLEKPDTSKEVRLSSVLAVKAALEAAGIEFIGSPEDRPGIRFQSSPS